MDESIVEQITLSSLQRLGYIILSGPAIAPGEPDAISRSGVTDIGLPALFPLTRI